MQEAVFDIRLMTRRRFLTATGALAASSALAACTTERQAIPYAPEPAPPPAHRAARRLRHDVRPDDG